ncbi:MAG: hypothetical protein NTW86_28915 [Candidatus Sumerlaeota bacterium]|nr:hypothetical protein [Candidatus Sumerlaeota bacterium]
MANKTTLTAPAGAPCTCPPWDITSLDELCPVCIQEWRIWWALCALDDVAADRAAAVAAGAPSGALDIRVRVTASGPVAYRQNGRWFDITEIRQSLLPRGRWLRDEALCTWRARGLSATHFAVDRFFVPPE